MKMLSSEEEDNIWANSCKIITEVGESVLGKTSGKSPPKDKETWWWSKEVKDAVKKEERS